MSFIDVAKARKETRAAETILHFNNAGSSLMPIPVSEALYDYLQQEEAYGGYETAVFLNDDLENFYTASAKLLNCKTEEIAYIENATRAWDMAFYSLAFQPGDKILTTLAEYGSNVVAYLQQAKRFGVDIVFVPDDEHGQIDCAALEQLIDDKVKLISISHIPTGGGLVNPAERVGQIAKAANIPYLLDACQSLGQMPVDVQAIGCDMLSGTGRKYLRGPRGTGLLYVRDGFLQQLEPPMLDQHAAPLVSPTEYQMRDDAKRFENWEQYFAGKVALGVAIDYALSWGLEAIQARIETLSAALRSELAALPGVTITDTGQQQCGIVTFICAGVEAERIKMQLREQGMNVSVSSGSGSLVSFVDRGLTAVVRASVHYYNNEAEIERFITAVKQIISK